MKEDAPDYNPASLSLRLISNELSRPDFNIGIDFTWRAGKLRRGIAGKPELQEFSSA
jgi:hypothetical protein